MTYKDDKLKNIANRLQLGSHGHSKTVLNRIRKYILELLNINTVNELEQISKKEVCRECCVYECCGIGDDIPLCLEIEDDKIRKYFTLHSVGG
jgi:hypothetical protein